MGQSESRARSLFIDIAKQMLLKRGIRVSRKQLQEFFSFVQTCSPWFPEEGTLNLETWLKLGKEIRNHYELYGADGTPAQAFSLWNALRDCLDLDPEAICLTKTLQRYESDTPCQALKKTNSYGSIPKTDTATAPLLQKGAQNSDSSSDSEDEDDKDDTLPPDYAAELDEEAARYHHDDEFPILTDKIKWKHRRKKKGSGYTPMDVGFRGALKKAREAGEPLLNFPVLFSGDNEAPSWEPLPFKLLRELKMAVKDFGPTSPYTLQLVNSIAAEWMTPWDWQQTAKSCLSPGLYLMWKADYEERARQLIQQSLFKRPQRGGFTMPMLMGTDNYSSAASQLKLPQNALREVTILAVQAWQHLPAADTRTTFLSNIKQGSQEPFADFVAKLEDAIQKIVENEEAAAILLKQLAFENANVTCQSLLRPTRRTGNINDYIKTCSEASPAYIQGVAMAAALQGKTYQQYLKEIGNNKNQKGNKTPSRPGFGLPGVCFQCGEAGHVKNRILIN
ncbi:endogenous retrovirus group K member 7 Gag polyprotein-like [Erethizon dorsatum]